MKYYQISEKDLLDLLTIKNRYQCLEADGVDNWEWYMTNKKEYISEELNIPIEKVEEEDLDFSDIAKVELKSFKKI